MKKLLRIISLIILFLVVILAMSCGLQSLSISVPETQPSMPVQNEAILLFGIGVHVEPFGAVVSKLVPGAINSPLPAANKADYHEQPLFKRHVQDIKLVAGIVERHGGKLTIQAQTPFTQIAAQQGEAVLADLEKKGHEIALHFHEDAHLGSNCESLPPELWTAVMKEEIGFIKRAGASSIRYWSGGNLYPGLLQAASMAGLEVMSDWKNPKTQQTDKLLVGNNPWRPMVGPNGSDVIGFAQHDPQGKIIFLPEGNYTRSDFASMRRSSNTGGDNAYFDYLKSELQHSLNTMNTDKVNVFHFTIHAGEFRGDIAEPFAVIERFLTEVVDPLVKTGKVRCATFSEMADTYKAWEKTHPGSNPRGEASTPGNITIPRQTPPADSARLGKVERDITYGIADNVALKMDIYHPLFTTGKVPALVYVHGGGWIQGDKALGAGVLDVSELVSRGYLVAAVNYRLAPQYKFPAQIEDVKCSIRYLRAHAVDYGIDPARIGVWGGSAGGHLVALLGTADSSAGFEGTGGYADQSSQVQAVVDMFGPTDLTVIFEGNKSDLLQQVFGTTDHSSDSAKRASPVSYITKDDSPFLILHGDRDTLVPLNQSQIMYDRLVKAGVPATLVVVKNAGHGFQPSGGIPQPSRLELTKTMADFFDKHLK